MLYPQMVPYPGQAAPRQVGIEIDKIKTEITNDVLQAVEIELNKRSPFKLRVSALAPSKDITSQQYSPPILCAIKQSNVQNVLNGNPSHPIPLGFLFRDSYNASTQRLLYAPWKPDGPTTEIATWQASSFGNKTLVDYQVFITKTGDLICVWRGEFYQGDEDSRRNPIVFPAGDYSNPVEVNLTTKPMAWLQNSGIDQIYASGKDYFIFAEYTRPAEGHTKAYVWKVAAPYTNPENWKIVMEKNAVQNGPVGTVKHFHTVNFDPWSGALLLTSGDDDAQIRTYISTDDGETWTDVAGGSQANRVLNFVFTKDYIYWGSDWQNATHGLYCIARDDSGFPDFSTQTKLTSLPQGQSTYVTAYLHHPNGLLLLDRIDVATSRAGVDVNFWSFEDQKLYNLAHFKPRPDRSGTVGTGFRASATTLYQSPNDPRIIVGFDRYSNFMDVLTNRVGSPLMTLMLEVL